MIRNRPRSTVPDVGSANHPGNGLSRPASNAILNQTRRCPMSPADAKQAIKSLRVHRKKVTASKKTARQFLIRAGILQKDGKKLTAQYR